MLYVIYIHIINERTSSNDSARYLNSLITTILLLRVPRFVSFVKLIVKNIYIFHEYRLELKSLTQSSLFKLFNRNLFSCQHFERIWGFL